MNKLNNVITNPLEIPPTRNYIYCKLDSGATKSYIRKEDESILSNVVRDNTQRQIILPNNEKINIERKGLINATSKLGTIAREASIVPQLKSASLLSVGTLCDDNCTVHFDKHKVDIIKNNEIIMQGRRNNKDGLYELPIEKVTTEKVNVIIRLDKDKMELANFLHGAMFSPSVTTLIKAIRNKQLLTFPGIDEINFKRIQDHENPR